ncbi:MAG TPA: hypothetical protein VG456_01985, partial [Candidatus Sulfopaludibacter sp.]|nr:hypothetical protein [Candidatus Sulfopaludibacter sp.]
MRQALLLALAFGCCDGATLKYWVQPCTQPETGCRASDPELAQWAMNAWQASSDGKLKLERTEDLAHAHIRLYWANG